MLKIEKVTINKLLNKTTIDIDISNRCRVLIGANGIGKSVSLKILYCLFTGNYIDILAVPFDSIDLLIFDTDTNERITSSLCYKDCFPTKKKIIEKLLQIPSYAHFYNGFEDFIKELDKKNVYEQFIYCTFKKKEFPSTINKIIYEKLELNYDFVSMENRFQDIDFIDVIGHQYGYNLFRFFGDSYFRRNSIYKIATRIISPVFYFDLVESYKINNMIVYTSFYKDREKEWAYSNEFMLSQHENFRQEIDLKDIEDIRVFDVENDIIKQCESELLESKCLNINKIINVSYFKPRVVEMINTIAIDYTRKYYEMLEQLSDEEKIKIVDEYDYKLDKKKNYYFTHYIRPVLISKSFFDYDCEKSDHRIEAAKKSIYRKTVSSPDNHKVEFEYMEDVILNKYFRNTPYDNQDGSKKKSSKDDKRIVKRPWPNPNDNYDFVTEFMKIPEAGDNTQATDDEEVEQRKKYLKLLFFEEILYRIILYEFIDEIIPIVTSKYNISDRIIKLQLIFNKYMIDRKVVICPSGCYIKMNNRKTLYDSNVVDLSNLSSGEKKIILLFTVAVFFNKTILLDEPELSLSLVWQEQLLPDILSISDNDIICATHSPYILNDETVQEYIKYIP